MCVCVEGRGGWCEGVKENTLYHLTPSAVVVDGGRESGQGKQETQPSI